MLDSPVINLWRDLSRQLSDQSLLSLFPYRPVLCYRVSRTLPPLPEAAASGGERNRQLP